MEQYENGDPKCFTSLSPPRKENYIQHAYNQSNNVNKSMHCVERIFIHSYLLTMDRLEQCANGIFPILEDIPYSPWR